MAEDLRGKFQGPSEIWGHVLKMHDSGRFGSEQLDVLSIVLEDSGLSPETVLEVNDVDEGLRLTVKNGRLKAEIDP